MEQTSEAFKIKVSSEVGTLRKLIIHSPDGGVDKAIPLKTQEWLFDDIVDLHKMRRDEYDLYVQLLLYFLDPKIICGKLQTEFANVDRAFFKPASPHYFNSVHVLDTQTLLAEILKDESVKRQLVAVISAYEGKPYAKQAGMLRLDHHALANTLISGLFDDGHSRKLIFPPIINFMFTRDISVVINDHVLITHHAREARSRESILTKYIYYNHPWFRPYQDRIIEIGEKEDYFLLPDEAQRSNPFSYEGGDFMTVSERHILIGQSERTTPYAINAILESLFEKGIVDKITVIKIPSSRLFMHIDTVFTQVSRSTWVVFDELAYNKAQRTANRYLPLSSEKDRVTITQYYRNGGLPRTFDTLEHLLRDVSRTDLGYSGEVQFIYAGGGVFPYNQREQWTDACNVLALREGVVIGYDRNSRTARAFEERGFNVIGAKPLIEQFETGVLTPDQVQDTLILLPSAELSRARGGPHCMSMPLLRDPL